MGRPAFVSVGGCRRIAHFGSVCRPRQQILAPALDSGRGAQGVTHRGAPGRAFRAATRFPGALG